MPAQLVEARDKTGNLVAEHGLVLRVVLTPGSQSQQLQVQNCGEAGISCAIRCPSLVGTVYP